MRILQFFKSWNEFYIFIHLLSFLHFVNFLRLLQLANVMPNKCGCLLEISSREPFN